MLTNKKLGYYIIGSIIILILVYGIYKFIIPKNKPIEYFRDEDDEFLDAIEFEETDKNQSEIELIKLKKQEKVLQNQKENITDEQANQIQALFSILVLASIGESLSSEEKKKEDETLESIRYLFEETDLSKEEIVNTISSSLIEDKLLSDEIKEEIVQNTNELVDNIILEKNLEIQQEEIKEEIKQTENIIKETNENLKVSLTNNKFKWFNLIIVILLVLLILFFYSKK